MCQCVSVHDLIVLHFYFYLLFRTLVLKFVKLGAQLSVPSWDQIWYQSIEPSINELNRLREDQMEAFKLQKKLDEAFDTIVNLKNKLRDSLRKRKKLIKKLSESQALIEQLEDQENQKSQIKP